MDNVFVQINTTTATYKENKMFHYEGGWPKDINMKDVEQTVRYKRKIEKDELYTHTMLQLLPVNIIYLYHLGSFKAIRINLHTHAKHFFQVDGTLHFAKQRLQHLRTILR